MLLRHTVPPLSIPIQGPRTITWVFAFSVKKGRDYTTSCVAVHNAKAQTFIIDLVRARFKPQELAKAVVAGVVKWMPQVVGIEDSGGARFLEAAILMEAQKTGNQQVIATCRAIDWYPVGTQKDAKKTRMASLHPLLMNDRLFFKAGLPYIEILYKEFELCLTSHHHDDIADVISQQIRYM